MKRTVLMLIAIFALTALAGGTLAPMSAQADQGSDGYWCWTAGYVVAISVAATSRDALQFMLTDGFGGFIATLALPAGPAADFVWSAVNRGAPIEVVTRAVPIGKGRGCASRLRSPVYMYPVDDSLSVGDNGGKG